MYSSCVQAKSTSAGGFTSTQENPGPFPKSNPEPLHPVPVGESPRPSSFMFLSSSASSSSAIRTVCIQLMEPDSQSVRPIPRDREKDHQEWTACRIRTPFNGRHRSSMKLSLSSPGHRILQPLFQIQRAALPSRYRRGLLLNVVARSWLAASR